MHTLADPTEYAATSARANAADKVLDVEVPIRRFAECLPDCGNRVGIRCQEPLAYKVGDVLGASAAGR
jgi:hypothetical protein